MAGDALAGGGETVTIPVADYKAILQPLDTLQKELNL